MRKLLLVLALFMASPAAAQSPNLAAAVHGAVAAACGNCIVGVTIGDPANPSTWGIDFVPGATAGQQAQAVAALAGFNLAAWQAVTAAISAGTIQIACAPGATVCTSAIVGTYRADAPAQQTMGNIAAGIGAAGRLPGGGATFNYADSAGAFHSFTAPQFLAFAAAVEDFAYALSQGTAPAQPVLIP